MQFSAKAVANEFINIAGSRALSPMKLQKLVYFAHGWCLAITGEPLIRESVEAWQFGPVIPDLYGALKQYGSGNVSGFTSEYDWRRQQNVTPRVAGEPSTVESRKAMDIIKQVWDAYGGQSAVKLSNVTHMDGTPWSNTYDPAMRSQVIPNDKIRDYFRTLASA